VGDVGEKVAGKLVGETEEKKKGRSMNNTEKKHKAVCLLSGGLDSCVATSIAKAENNAIYALSFQYGQRHKKELEHAKKIAVRLGAKAHKIIELDLTQIGGSALTDESLGIPERPPEEIGVENNIPVTYVPARNIMFLSIALGYAEAIGAHSIFIGANAIDYSGYPDCRPEFFDAFQNVADVGTKTGLEGNPIKIRAPLIKMTKAEIIKKGLELDAPLALTWSCYKGGDKACGVCDSCRLRLKGFSEAGIKDPVEYEPQ
jgi:7-cyano-7-deazaguanine synthase